MSENYRMYLLETLATIDRQWMATRKPILDKLIALEALKLPPITLDPATLTDEQRRDIGLEEWQERERELGEP